MSFELFQLSDKKKWNSILGKFHKKFQDVYFTPEYFSLYQKNGDGIANCFFYNSRFGKVIYPFIKNSINQLGYKLKKQYFDIQGVYGYNGCIYSNLSDNLINDFHKEFNKYCKENNIVSEFVRFHPIIKNHLFSKKHMRIQFNRKTIYLDLNQTYEKIFNFEYSSNNRNMIRKGKKSLYVEISKDRKDFDLFRKNYLNTMKKINSKKYYLFSAKYFAGFLQDLKTQTYVLNIYSLNKKIQNSMILLINGDYAHYHLSGRSKNCTINASNNLMLDEAIKFAQKKRCKYFHLGGGSTIEANDTLLKFKSNFSKTKLDFYIGSRIHNKKIYDSICNIWDKKNPNLKDKMANYNFKYRQIDA